MDNANIMSKIDAEFNAVFQHLSNLSTLATQADLSGDQLAAFLGTKHAGVMTLTQARNKIASYLGAEKI